MVGNTHSIMLPKLERNRSTRLRGLRLVHTHLKEESLSKEDLSDLCLLRLDYITAITIDSSGLPKLIHSAYILPTSSNGYHLESPCNFAKLPENFSEQIEYLDSLISQKQKKGSLNTENGAILVGVYTPEMRQSRSTEASIKELKELCRTAEVNVIETVIQKRSSLDPISVLGSGKAQEIALLAVQNNAELIIFDLELSPAQAKRLSEICELKILDRTQIILDIFAKNATTRDGKLQVELAQLRYLKGRLSEKDDNMSRLTGGIGGRGPGETKLEVGRRNVSQRIKRLEKELTQLKKRRLLNRTLRAKQVPTVSIVGYTNSGKSTLLNSLTNSLVQAQDKLFATLDPRTRRLRFPKEKEIVIADTVGFIHDLPKELSRAFSATLEELIDATLLLHCIDASDPQCNQKLLAVKKILSEMDIAHIPVIQVYNKCDLIEKEHITFLNSEANNICISAKNKNNFKSLLKIMEQTLYPSSEN